MGSILNQLSNAETFLLLYFNSLIWIKNKKPPESYKPSGGSIAKTMVSHLRNSTSTSL